ncbi:MAG: TlyA family RNA methyltransferase, partial [bacterium]|nr:TlyA family RNA methyltransferase [bacterium]
VDGQKAAKAGHAVAADSRIEVTGRPPYVSRGGGQLAAAPAAFGIDPAGRICLDIGASTGGFTDCLLQRGAARVHAVDTGAGQIAWKLRTDARVVLHENTNARYLKFSEFGEGANLVVCDVSFISVTLIVPVLPPLLAAGAEMVILVKPQFEVGRGQVGKGGIVRDPALHRAACERVEKAVAEIGYRSSIMDSPILGAEGNREFLLYGQR